MSMKKQLVRAPELQRVIDQIVDEEISLEQAKEELTDLASICSRQADRLEAQEWVEAIERKIARRAGV